MGLISNGTTIFDNGAMASGFGGSMTFISSQTASASASISFTTGIDSTYKEYVFYFVNLHASSSGAVCGFNLSTDGGANYNVTKTTTAFRAYYAESGATAALGYSPGEDLAQSTADQLITVFGASTNNDACWSGKFNLFNPSSTTYVKHFISRTNEDTSSAYSVDTYVAGYGNTTSAINAVIFRMSSGNIDAGKILLFGIN